MAREIGARSASPARVPRRSSTRTRSPAPERTATRQASLPPATAVRRTRASVSAGLEPGAPLLSLGASHPTKPFSGTTVQPEAQEPPIASTSRIDAPLAGGSKEPSPKAFRAAGQAPESAKRRYGRASNPPRSTQPVPNVAAADSQEEDAMQVDDEVAALLDVSRSSSTPPRSSAPGKTRPSGPYISLPQSGSIARDTAAQNFKVQDAASFEAAGRSASAPKLRRGATELEALKANVAYDKTLQNVDNLPPRTTRKNYAALSEEGEEDDDGDDDLGEGPSSLPVPPSRAVRAIPASKRQATPSSVASAPKAKSVVPASELYDEELLKEMPRRAAIIGGHPAPEGYLWERQIFVCRVGQNAGMPSCQSCRSGKSKEGDDSPNSCLFRNIRYYAVKKDSRLGGSYYDKHGDNVNTFVLSYAKAPTILQLPGPALFNTLLQPEHVHRLQPYIAAASLADLEQEVAHARLPEVVVSNAKPEWRAYCDVCKTALLTGSWLCSHCSRELCHDCHAELKSVSKLRAKKSVKALDQARAADPCRAEAEDFLLDCCSSQNSHYGDLQAEHKAEFFVPLTRLSASILEPVLARARELAPMAIKASRDDLAPISHPDVVHAEPVDVNSRGYDVVAKDKLTDDLAESLFATGLPFVVTGVRSDKGVWTPDYIIEKYGDQVCEVERCSDRTPILNDGKPMTVQQFFTYFGKKKPAMFRVECRNKDFPPSERFKEAFDDEYGDFILIIPMPGFTRDDGVYNIAAFYALNASQTDLGPKGYNATKGDHDSETGGSTRLHCDVADAINEMPYAMTAEGKPGVAIWHLWRAEDAGRLREYLYAHEAKKQGKSIEEIKATLDDPIHSQQTYVSREMIKELSSEKWGVKAIQILQKAHEAVNIPAGCPHQVSNDADCVKVAIDFVSPHNLDRIRKVMEEFRSCYKGLAYKDDILALKHQLFYGFLTCEANLRAWRGEKQLELCELVLERPSAAVLPAKSPAQSPERPPKKAVAAKANPRKRPATPHLAPAEDSSALSPLSEEEGPPTPSDDDYEEHSRKRPRTTAKGKSTAAPAIAPQSTVAQPQTLANGVKNRPRQKSREGNRSDQPTVMLKSDASMSRSTSSSSRSVAAAQTSTRAHGSVDEMLAAMQAVVDGNLVMTAAQKDTADTLIRGWMRSVYGSGAAVAKDAMQE